MVDRRRVWGVIARWTTELAVVFVGVYGAFALAEWEESRERERRAEMVRAALAEEIAGIIDNTGRVAVNMPPQLAMRDSLVARGQMPRLNPMLEPILVDTHIWQSTIAGGGIELLDVETFYRLSEFYNLLNAGFVRLEQLRRLSEQMLLPRLDAPIEEFYRSDPVALRPQYDWYMRGFREVSIIARCVTVRGEALLENLGAPVSEPSGLSGEDCENWTG